MAEIDLKSVVTAATQEGLANAAQSTDNSLTPADVAKVTATVVAKVAPAASAEANAILQNMTDTEPLWRSRNFWTASVMLVASVAGIAGYSLTAADQAQAINNIMQVVQGATALVTALGSAYVMWNRVFVSNKKPIGK